MQSHHKTIMVVSTILITFAVIHIVHTNENIILPKSESIKTSKTGGELMQDTSDQLAKIVDAIKESKTEDQFKARISGILDTLDAEYNDGIMSFNKPLPADKFCNAMGWRGCYGVSTDVHQNLWWVMIWNSDIKAQYGKRISVNSPQIDDLTVSVGLSGRPKGKLPNVVAGASPAYDLSIYPAEVETFYIFKKR